MHQASGTDLRGFSDHDFWGPMVSMATIAARAVTSVTAWQRQIGCQIHRNITQMLHVWYIYLHNWVIFGVNVGKYSIHGASGIEISCE